MAKKELQISIVEKVKKELGITENCDHFTLYKLLTKARNNNHPDKFPEELKDEASEKFKTLNALSLELNIFINQAKLNKSPVELIRYEELYNDVKLNSENIELRNENDKLKDEIKEKLSDIDILKKSLEDIQVKNLSNSQAELIDLYKPKKTNLILPGITAILLIAINIISTLNIIKSKVASILPFGSQYLNLILFSILLISIIDIFVKKYHYSKIQRISHQGKRI